MSSRRGKKGTITIFRNAKTNQAFSYLWNEEAGGYWELHGEVQSGPKKKTYKGDKIFPKGEYDYVFEIEQEGRTYYLPYNDGQSQWEIAEKFLKINGISLNCIPQIIQHIKTHSRNLDVVFKERKSVVQEKKTS